MGRMLGKWSRATLRAALLVGLALGLAGNAVAAPTKINSMPTSQHGNFEVVNGSDYQWLMKTKLHAMGPILPLRQDVDNSNQRPLLFCTPLP